MSVAVSGSTPHEHRCPLCGGGFANPQEHCRGCPFSRGCATICCPNCGYTYVERSHLVALFQAARARLSRWFVEGRP